MVIITISILTLAMLAVNVLLAVRGMTTAALTSMADQVDVTVYFEPKATTVAVEQVKNMVSAWPQVQSLDFLNAEQALATFKARHEANAEITSSLILLENNPLGAILIIHAKKTSDYQEILAALDRPEFKSLVQRRSFEDRSAILQRVSLFTEKAQALSLGLAAVFAIIALLIIFNAMRVAIYTQREEISIKRLVGATNGFIRAPFFVESAWYVIVCMALVVAGLLVGVRVLDPYLGPLFTGNGFSLEKFFFASAWQPLGMEAIILLVVVWGTSFLAMRRYLRV